MVQQIPRTDQLARDVGADVDAVLADRMELKHLIETCGAVHLGGRQVEHLGNMHHGILGYVTILFLRQMQQRNQRRLLARKSADYFLGDGYSFAGKTAHRSTSPSTGSIDEITATASATKPPRIMCGRHCTLTKLGARTCMRYGTAEPSLTM